MERKPSRFELRLPPDLEDRIDNWRRHEPDLPPRAEAARRLIVAGLTPGKEAAVGKAPVVAIGMAEEVSAVPAGEGRRGMPWHGPKVRSDAVKTQNVRLPEDLVLQLDWLAADLKATKAKATKQEIVVAALREYLGRELRRRGISPEL
jgi:predicted DNA-binding protein